MRAMRFMQNPAVIDYCNVISNLLQSNMRENKKIYNGIHSSGIFPEKSPNAEFLEANNTEWISGYKEMAEWKGNS